jgi:amino acid transporter
MALIVGWILWCVVVLLALGWAYGLRNIAASGQPQTWGTVVLALFWWVIALVFLFSHANKLHILWAAPVAFVLSFLVAPPVGIPVLSPIVLGVAHAFLTVVTLGVKRADKGSPEWPGS